MKSSRQTAILEIIREQSIETQEQLAEALSNRGLNVTQATISRDIKELRLQKVMTPSGGYRYAPPDHAESDMNERLTRMLSDSLLSVASSGNMLVIRTISGTAGAAAEALDALHWPEVLGTLAGDNTIFMVIREDAMPSAVAAKITNLMK